MRIALSHAHSQWFQGAQGKSNGIHLSEWPLSKGINILLKEKLLEKRFEVKIIDPCEKNYRKHLRVTIEEINAWKADLAIECHFNGSKDPRANGSEVLYFSNSEKGLLLAILMFDELRRQTPIKPRGLVPRKDVAFLKYTKCPACILEPAFLTNSSDIEFLRKIDSKDIIAISIFMGILKYKEAIWKD